MTVQLNLLDRDWLDEKMPIVAEWVRGNPHPWTSDDLHTLLGEPPNPNWFGVLLAKLKNTGLIERVGWRESERKSANGRAVRVWQRKT